MKTDPNLMFDKVIGFGIVVIAVLGSFALMRYLVTPAQPTVHYQFDYDYRVDDHRQVKVEQNNRCWLLCQPGTKEEAQGNEQ